MTYLTYVVLRCLLLAYLILVSPRQVPGDKRMAGPSVTTTGRDGSRIVTAGAASVPSDPARTKQCPSLSGVCDLLSRDAKPTWTRVSFDGFSLLVPYSQDWRIGQVAVATFEVDPTAHVRAIVFGRPVDGLNDVIREYRVYRTNEHRLVPANEVESFDCGAGKPATVALGDVHGVMRFDGGAKWCAVVLSFTRHAHTYYIERQLEPYFSLHGSVHAFDDEMRRIVLSIHE